MNKAKKFMKLFCFLTALLCIAALNTGTLAYAQTLGGFSTRAIIPENQVDKKQTYFDLRMKPGDEQELQIVITNSKAETLTAEVQLNAASTGRNGTISYTDPDVRDKDMKLSINDVATLVTQNVTVPPNSSEDVKIRVKMPEESFDGVILGGIAVTGDSVDDGTQEVQGVSLKNTITYVIALKLTQTDDKAAPDFELESVVPQLVNYRTAVIATLRNKAARIVKDMEINATVYQKGSDHPLHSLELTEAEMAPLSTGAFVIDWNNEALKPGMYRMKMIAGYDGRIWEWDEEFAISGEANTLNKVAKGIEKDYTWLYISLGIALFAIIAVLAYLFGKRRRTRED